MSDTREPEIEEREGFWVVGRSARASNDDPSPIGALWGGIFADPFADQVPNRTSDDIHSVYCAYEGDHTAPYTVLLGYRTEASTPVPEGLVRHFVPAGTYARFVAEGPPPQSVMDAWQRIWNAGLDRAYDTDVEVHPHAEGRHIEILVGVK